MGSFPQGKFYQICNLWLLLIRYLTNLIILCKLLYKFRNKSVAKKNCSCIIKQYPICGGNSVVECLLAKEDVASSSLVSRSIKSTHRWWVLFICKLNKVIILFCKWWWSSFVLYLRKRVAGFNKMNRNCHPEEHEQIFLYCTSVTLNSIFSYLSPRTAQPSFFFVTPAPEPESHNWTDCKGQN